MGILQLDSFFGANKEGEDAGYETARGGRSEPFLHLQLPPALACGAWPLASGGAWRPHGYTQIFTALFHGLRVNPCKINWVSFRWFVFSAPLKTWQPGLSLKAISMHISFISQWLVIFSENVIFNIYLSLKLLPCKYYKNEFRRHGEFVMIYLPQ